MINLEIVNKSKKVFINYIEDNIDTIGQKIGLSLLDGVYLEGKVIEVDNNGDLVLKIKNAENRIIKSGMVRKMVVNK